MNVNAGELNKKISIYSREKTEDADGYETISDVLVHSCWAKFSRTSGTETFKANADFSETKVRFLIRYTKAPIDRKMFVRYAGTDYEITFINDYGDAHQYIELWCKRLTNAR